MEIFQTGTVPLTDKIISFNMSDKLTISPDQQSTVSGCIKDCSLALSQLFTRINSNELEMQYATSLLSLIEFNMAKVSKITGISTNTARDIEDRHAQIRQANARIQELERQLGEAADINLVGPCVSLLEDKMRRWWSTEGFGHLSEFSISKGFASISLSTYLFGKHHGIMSDTPVSGKESHKLWLQSLRDQGYVFLSENSGDKELIDCDKNKALISALITSAIPSAIIKATTNQGNRDGQLILRDIEVFVRNLADINNLPAPD